MRWPSTILLLLLLSLTITLLLGCSDRVRPSPTIGDGGADTIIDGTPLGADDFGPECPSDKPDTGDPCLDPVPADCVYGVSVSCNDLWPCSGTTKVHCSCQSKKWSCWMELDGGV
jgi:hypothetical protein